MFGGKAAVRDDLIELGKIGYVNHRFSAEFRVVRHDDYALRAFHHGANRLDHQRAGVTEAFGGNAADSQNGDVGRDAMEHAFADGAKLNAEVRIKVSAGQRDLCLPALPKDLGNRNRVSDDLNRTAEKTSGNFGYSRSATEDDCLPILNEIRGSASDP